MNQPLQLLLIEDSADDAAMVETALRRAGYIPACHRVETREALSSGNKHRWHCPTSSLPGSVA